MINHDRIERAVQIINYAIENNISVAAASKENGFAETYVKNVKTSISDSYDNDTISDEDYAFFMDAFENYLKNRFNNENPDTVLVEGEKLFTKGGKVFSSANNSNKELYVKTRGDQQILPEETKNSNTNQQLKFNVNGKNGEIEWVSGSNYPKGHIKTLDQLLNACNVDENTWNIKDYTVNKWDVTSTSTGVPITIENFQVKARLEKKQEMIEIYKYDQIFKEIISNYNFPVLNPSLIKYRLDRNDNLVSENNLLEISIMDLHIGKLAWAGETGENYDVKIASKRFVDAINNLLKRASGFEYSRILFPIGNDFFNSDNMNNTTTHGTPQDEDLRWQHTFKIGSKLVVDGINMLKQVGVPVDVLLIPGNHDFERNFYLGSFLEAWFNDDPMVNINNHASPRKYYEFGNLLLGFTHGDSEKQDSLPLLMATERKESWGKTHFHEWHLGHIHRKREIKYTVLDKAKTLNEDLGVTIRYLSSLTGTEEWHHKKGFIGQIKAADAFIWNYNTGLIAQLVSNLVI